MMTKIANQNIPKKSRDYLFFIFLAIIILFFAFIIEKEIEIPGMILYSVSLGGLCYLFIQGIKKPEIVVYFLTSYLPFSRILVGDFGQAMTAINLTNILTIIVIIGWIFSSVSSGKRIYKRTSLDIPLLIFMFFGCLSLVRGTLYFGADYALSFIAPLKRWLTPLFFFFLVFNVVRDKQTIKNIVVIMMFVLTIAALMAIKDYIDIGQVSSLEKARVGGIMEQSNSLAAFFVYYMFLFAGFFLVYWRNFKYWFLLIPFALCFRGIMVTFSRGGYVAFAAAGLTIAFFRNKVLFIAVTLALILAIINPVLLPKGIASRMSSTFRNDQIYASSLEEEVDSSAATRIAIWKGSLPMINDHKWFGIGYGVFPYLIPFYAPEVGEITPHNTYILIAAEMGIFALLAFLLVLLVIFRNSYKLYKMTQDKFFKALSLGMLGSLGGVLIANVFGGRLDSEELSSYFWILAALVFRALYIERKSKNTLLKKSQ